MKKPMPPLAYSFQKQQETARLNVPIRPRIAINSTNAFARYLEQKLAIEVLLHYPSYFLGLLKIKNLYHTGNQTRDYCEQGIHCGGHNKIIAA